MADYISRQKAIEAIMDLPDCPNGYSDTYDKECIIGTLEEVPTADVVERKIGKCISGKCVSGKDVVEVVRCRECKYWGESLTKAERNECDVCADLVCTYWMSDGLTRDDFCSHGERRDDGDGTEAG